MAISVNGSHIVVDSGFATGTATGGTATSLSGAGFSTAWQGRILWIQAGTGAGQSRFIKSVNGTTINVDEPWDTLPDATSQFIIAYNWADVVSAVASASYVGAAGGKVINISSDLRVANGGALGDTLATIVFTLGNVDFNVQRGGFFQHGRTLRDGSGVDGGSITVHHQSASYPNPEVRGLFRLIGAKFLVKQSFPESQNGQYRVGTGNLASNCDGMTFLDTYTNNLYVELCSRDAAIRSTFENAPFFPKERLARFEGVNLVETAFVLTTQGGSATNGADFTGLSIGGLTPPTGAFALPLWINFEYNLPEGVCYFFNFAVDTELYPGEADFVQWRFASGRQPSTGVVYRGITVKPVVRDTAGNAVAGATVGLLRQDGSGGWMVNKLGQAGNYAPVRSETLTTDAAGTASNAVDANAPGMFVITREIRDNGQQGTPGSNVTQFNNMSFGVRMYGFRFQSSGRTYPLSDAVTESVFLLPDAAVTEPDAATTAALTTITTVQELYDYSRYWLALPANFGVADSIILVGDDLDFGALDVVLDPNAPSVFDIQTGVLTVKAAALTGNVTTTGQISFNGGAAINGIVSDVNGTTGKLELK